FQEDIIENIPGGKAEEEVAKPLGRGFSCQESHCQQHDQRGSFAKQFHDGHIAGNDDKRKIKTAGIIELSEIDDHGGLQEAHSRTEKQEKEKRFPERSHHPENAGKTYLL